MSKPRRVLLVHRYFWPDVPTYAHMLRFIGARLAADGHDVTVFCGPPTYNDVYRGPPLPRTQTLDGFRVRRVGLPRESKARPVRRAVSMLVFALRLVLHALVRRYDVIMVTTIPPVVMGVAARLTRTPFVYHCMDLYPEVAEAAGLSRNRLLLRVARRLDTATCRRARAVVVLSEDMRATLLARGPSGSNVVVLNNFSLVEDAADVDVLPAGDGRFRITFAGNMGRFQGLEDLVDAAHAICPAHPSAEFVFLGSGVSVPALRARAGRLDGAGVRFVEHQPVAVAARALEQSQLAIVSLRPGIFRVAYPSKTATCLAAGCRLLVVVEEGSELARLVRDEDLGSVCAPGDTAGLVRAIAAELARGPVSAAERARLRGVGEKHFGRAAKLSEWSRLIGRLDG